jgi:hypothetical protein
MAVACEVFSTRGKSGAVLVTDRSSALSRKKRPQ